MLYDSLLLNCGGGIIGKASKSEQFKGSATLAIGLGGTGVAALSVLKGKIYQQLNADNPEDPIAQYEGIQLLAIDSDDGDYKKYRGNCRLRKDEFFSICNPQLAAALKAKKLIKDDPLLHWMDIDHITQLLAPEGAGGIRQVGRYLLMSKTSELERVIQAKCTTAMKKRATQNLDIYIFAGISGGTGSGCFLDTCYMVRRIAENNGWNAKIMGYFFLPDVVTSKQEVANNPGSLAYNNANGYAAMKELDYLMSLKDANDWFTQAYSSTLKVHTQEPPVDMCHLISSYKADGSMVPNGFTYGINVASDYVMSYLADVDLGGGSDGTENGLTMRGHQANVAQGVANLSRRYGANLSYHIMGACNAEIPMSQINTYLACGFYGKFLKAISGERIVVTKSAVSELAKQHKLTAELVQRDVAANTTGLSLPEVDRKLLAQSKKPAPGYLNDEWAVAGNDWLDRLDGQLVANGNGLNMKMDNYDYARTNAESLIGRVFRKLWELSVDPNYGPYYAAQILHNGAYDLTSEIDGAIRATEERIRTQEMYRQDTDRNLEMCKSEFFDARNPSKSAYAAYESAVGKWFYNVREIKLLRKTAEVLRQFKKQVQDLYQGYFKPLCDMLDNLRETFVENQTYLQMPEATEGNAYTWQILTFKDIQKNLDERIAALSAKELVTDFVSSLLFNYEAWINGDQDKIAMLIRTRMLELFKDESARSLQDYLLEKYPRAKNDPKLLPEEVEEDIMNRVHNSAVPMFWCDPNFKVAETFENSNLSVPASASAVCSAADNFKSNHKESNYTVRKTGIGDRIFALRLCSGVPLYAYQGITLLKDYYDKAASTAAGVGSHLYADTGRGTDGSGHKDWRHFLPTPMPYSRKAEMIPEGPELLKLYDEGEAAGVIGINDNKEYVIYMTGEYTPKAYKREDFVVDGRFSMPAYEAELNAMRGLIENLHVNCQQFPMKNDGDPGLNEGVDVVGRCRKDYFLHYPLLQQAVRDELKKLADMKADLASLEAVRGDFQAYEADMDRYCGLIFYRGLRCENSMQEEDHNKIARIYCTYVDKYEDTREFEFSARKEAMPYGKEYPLYQGFLTYRSLEAKKTPRLELDKQAAENESRAKKIEDLCIPYDLEQLWSVEAMDELKEAVSHRSVDEAEEIIRFYEGLRNRIRTLKDESPVWLTGEKRAALKGAATGEGTPVNPDPNAYWHVWDPMTNKTLVVYAQYGATMAYDQTTQQWVSVRADMKVWNGQAWVDLKTDPYFAAI